MDTNEQVAVASVQITDAMPTGTGALYAGCGLDLGVEHNGVMPPANVDIGTGEVVVYGPYEFAAAGDISFDTLGFSGSGTWSINLLSEDGGSSYTATWSIDATINGPGMPGPVNSSGSRPVSAVESGSGDDTTITYSSGGFNAVQSFQNDSPVQKAKVYFAFTIGGFDVQLYLYNTSVYGI